MKSLKLITETAHETYLLKEEYDPTRPKTLKFKGIFLQSEKRNGNGRIYPYEELKAEVDRFTEEMINTKRALSELEHPERCDINPDRACSLITSLEEDNKQWIGEAVILCSDPKFGIKGTPCGDILAGIANYGVAFGMSSRAMGNVSKDGKVTDLKLVTIDTVLNPSIGEMCTNNANRMIDGLLESKQFKSTLTLKKANNFVDGILESKRFMVDNHGMIVEKAYHNLNRALQTIPSTRISLKKASYLGKAVTDFFNTISN